LRAGFGVAAREARRLKIKETVLSLDSRILKACAKKHGWSDVAEAITEGWLLGSYVFDAYKSSASRAPRTQLVLVSGDATAATEREARAGTRAGTSVAGGVAFCRDLANMPPNDLYPETLASKCRSMARSEGLTCQILTKADLEREKMGAFLGVSQGSARPPRMVVLKYKAKAKNAKTVVLVGKAVTFDAGGISIKPARGMEDMKFDMAGGAAVAGAMKAIASLKPKVNVVGIIPASENLLGASAYRPGDILTSAAGKTIEILNTDAEGRLLLADALHYSRRFKPDAVIDLATLTGAVVVALGSKLSGLFSTDDGFAEDIADAAKRCGERLWRLPIFPEAYDAMKSRYADLRNSGGREAGASTAAAFLANFTEGLTWAHLDIAGTGWTQRASGYHSVGATGAGVRLLCELAESY
ncbi:MAG: leucyl aminopeptidase, partial [Planctomycetota bacterium]